MLAGGVVAEDVRPFLPLAERLGKVFTAVAGGAAASVDVVVRGAVLSHDVTVLKLAATKGLFDGVVEDRVSYVNAPLLAAERGVTVSLTTVPETGDEPATVALQGALADGRRVEVTGTLHHDNPRLTSVDGFEVELATEGVLLFFRYADRPGVVGTVGTILGGHGVNIAAMQVSRRQAGGEALMTLTVDEAVAADLLAKAAEAIGASAAAAVDLTDD